MSTNTNTHVIDNIADKSGGLVWHRLHSEREDICDALLKENLLADEAQPGIQGPSSENIARQNWHRELLQSRLRKVDDALDRLLAGSYGNCSKCGRWIEDTKLDFDPAVAFCLECWDRIQTKH